MNPPRKAGRQVGLLPMVASDDPRHASPAGYVAGCRGECCKTAAKLYERRRATRRYLAGGTLVVAGPGPRRRLRALVAIGYGLAELDTHLERKRTFCHNLASNDGPVLLVTADAIKQVYDRLHMTPKVGPIAERQKRLALAKAWAPPLAWDDIDDPAEAPTGWAYQPSSRADRLAELLERGAGLYEVLRDLDLTRDTFNTWCTRHGHRDTYLALVSAVNDTSNAHVQRRAS